MKRLMIALAVFSVLVVGVTAPLAVLSVSFAPSQVIGADFIGRPHKGVAPQTVHFEDASVGSIASWEWDFGDGSGSTDQNPTHTYHQPGVYTVSLLVAGEGAASSLEKTDYIEVLAAGGQRITETGIEVLREGYIIARPGGGVALLEYGSGVYLEARDRVEVTYSPDFGALTSGIVLQLFLLQPGWLINHQGVVEAEGRLAYLVDPFAYVGQPIKRYFVAPVSGVYRLLGTTNREEGIHVDVAVTRYVPVASFPGPGDANADNNVDVLDLVTVATNLGMHYGP